MHAATVYIVYTIDRCTLLGSNRVYLEANTFINPASLLKHGNLSRVDGVYMLTGLTIHTVCRNCICAVALIDDPGIGSVSSLSAVSGNLTLYVNLCGNALNSGLDILCNEYVLTGLSLCEVVRCIKVLADQDSVQCIRSVLYGTEYIIAVLAADLCCLLMIEVSNACAKSYLGVRIAVIYNSVNAISYLRYLKCGRYSCIIVSIFCGTEYNLSGTFYMVCAKYDTLIGSIVALCTDRSRMAKSDGRRRRCGNLYAFLGLKKVPSVYCSTVLRCAAKNSKTLSCKGGYVVKLIAYAFIIQRICFPIRIRCTDDIFAAIDHCYTGLIRNICGRISCEVCDACIMERGSSTLVFFLSLSISVRKLNTALYPLIFISLCKGDGTIISNLDDIKAFLGRIAAQILCIDACT